MYLTDMLGRACCNAENDVGLEGARAFARALPDCSQLTSLSVFRTSPVIAPVIARRVLLTDMFGLSLTQKID